MFNKRESDAKGNSYQLFDIASKCHPEAPFYARLDDQSHVMLYCTVCDQIVWWGKLEEVELTVRPTWVTVDGRWKNAEDFAS